MSETADPSMTSGEGARAPLRAVVWTLVAALLCAGGILMAIAALFNISGGLPSLVWWLGPIPAAGGFFMLMSPRSGPARA